MISRKHRFIGPNSLRFVYKAGNTTRGPLFSVKAATNNRRRTYRVAVVVSRKVHKSAVARNRMRRKLYEAVRNLEDGITQPFDIVITVFGDGVLEEAPKSLAKQLKNQLVAAGVLNRPGSG